MDKAFAGFFNVKVTLKIVLFINEVSVVTTDIKRGHNPQSIIKILYALKVEHIGDFWQI